MDKCLVVKEREQQKNKLEESRPFYLTFTSILDAALERQYEVVYSFFEEKILVSHLVQNGVSFVQFEQIMELSCWTEKEWAEQLELSQKSLQRYKVTEQFKFKPMHTEKILQQLELTTLGLDVFETKEKFLRWLETPNFALGKLKPKDLLSNTYGKQLVIGEIHRINHGIFA